MQNVWDFLEIGMSKMLFSTAVTEYMADKGKRLRGPPWRATEAPSAAT